MNIPLPHDPTRRAPEARDRGFTLIEITIALAVVAFALVAIIGVLPIGLNVQRDNRAETIVNHDGNYWMEAIRGGGVGLVNDDTTLGELTNYVEFIVIEHANGRTVVQNFHLNPTQPYFRSGREIIGLLSTPFSSDTGYAGATNVYALVRSLTGVATEKPGANTTANSPGLDFAFKYKLRAQVVPSVIPDPNVPNQYLNPNEDFNSSLGLPQANLAPVERLASLFDVRMRFTWPILKSDASAGTIETGRRQKSFRSMASRYVASETNLVQSLVYSFLVP